jgi:hypothetical protein
MDAKLTAQSSKLTTSAPDRHLTETRRLGPRQPVSVRVPFGGHGALGRDATPAIDELVLEATDAAGQPADWLCDEWLVLAVQAWGDQAVTVRLLPTPGAMLHAVTLHEFEMLRRIAPRWRLVGEAHVEDFTTEAAVEATAYSPYHEVRVVDAPRGDVAAHPQGRCWTVDRLFGLIRGAQQRAGATLPILVRLMAPTGKGW